ncbi:hypothetical protein TNCV_2775411 [Trichonephila clavipes]|nr:hypothetical protein TNCV_2775411 [Trichonephila clavipes]
MECVCPRSRTQDLWCKQSKFLQAAPSILRGVLPPIVTGLFANLPNNSLVVKSSISLGICYQTDKLAGCARDTHTIRNPIGMEGRKSRSSKLWGKEAEKKNRNCNTLISIPPMWGLRRAFIVRNHVQL